MIVKFLRENVYGAGLLALIRIYIGWEWLSHGWEKLTGATPFDAAGFLKNAIAKPVLDGATKEVLYPNFKAFLEAFALPNVDLINFMIPLGEFLVGLGLVLGVLTSAAGFFGMLMNFMFLFAGTVSSNPWFILVGFLLFYSGPNAGRFGGDYWLMPWLKRVFKRTANDFSHSQ